MNRLDLIGKVATELLRRNLRSESTTDGVARFLLDRLTGLQVAQICKDVMLDPEFRPNIDIKIPRSLVDEYGLPDEALTDERTTFWRNAPCDKPAILLANTNDDQGQSLRDITSIGAGELKSYHDIWVDVASKGLSLNDLQKTHWAQALKGLLSAGEFSLDQFSDYIVKTRLRIKDESVTLIEALGWALPSLRLPRDSGYFTRISESKLGQINQWRKVFQQSITKRGCLLIKQTSTRQIIEVEQLRKTFNEVKDDIPKEIHQSIEAFIDSEPGWNSEASILANLEWEQDNISLIFSGLREVKLDLATETLQFYDYNFPDSLSEEDLIYLGALKKRKIKEPIDDDKDFYDKHRNELDKNRSLKSKWDKFVYGKPIECNDFLIGLLEAIERLFEQSGQTIGKKRLLIKTQKERSKSKWLDINANVGLFFCTRYRGLEQLTDPQVSWETHWLFEYDKLLQEAMKRAKYKENTSTAKAATQIKFYVELETTDNLGLHSSVKIQLIWQGNPNAIGMELNNDLTRLVKLPFIHLEVNRNPVNKKGKLQGLSLDDVGTLEAVFRQDRGSLVSALTKSIDLGKIFIDRLNDSLKDGKLTSQAHDSIKSCWNEFSSLYKKALNDWYGTTGLSSDSLIKQSEAYDKLLLSLQQYAQSDRNRLELWQPILDIGNAKVLGGRVASIIAPWHPMRMMAIAVKFRQIAGLLNHILESEQVDFGDSSLYFSDLKTELEHPYYPEISVGYKGIQPILLTISDTVNEYSLMEKPIRDSSEHETNENPREASLKILSLVKRYLELQPHERTNLGLALYNCDSIRLPYATVEILSSLHEEEREVRCQVILRHNDTVKLNELYEKMVESTDTDPDMFVSSEVARDFMARLRIEVMADIAPVLDSKDGKPVDIVFLHDIISRQAKSTWLPSVMGDPVNVFQHVPPRWSKRRAAAKDELKSSVYIVCPRQPSVGQSYLESVRCVTEGEHPSNNTRFLPARQISFQEQKLSSIFEEVHKLGEWVVNYDDLLERRQLMNHGIKVIRYQQSRTQGHNLIVSTKSSLNLLHALVIRRLNALNLGLPDSDVSNLAERFIEEANIISGDIVLRAAKRGIFASELIGLVLSKLLLFSETGNENSIGWYFLDDYASWLGQREQQIADILAISPKVDQGKKYLQVIVSEAKYVSAKGLSEARKVSQRQLRDTIARINTAIFGNPGRLDRDLWLSRLADMLLDNIELTHETAFQVEEWRDAIRQGNIPIDLRGYSQVFLSNNGDGTIESERVPIMNVDRCYQEVFNREHVRALVLAYNEGKSLSNIRELLGNDKPWLVLAPSLPANRVNINYQRIVATSQINDKITPPEQVCCPKDEEEKQKPIKPQKVPLDSGNNIVTWGQPALAEWIEQNIAQAAATSEEDHWLNMIANKLKNALISYNLQSKVLSQRLTPNAAIIRLKGSDRLRVEDIDRKRSQLLTTHALDILSISPAPGEVIVSVARPQRQTVSLADVWKVRQANTTPAEINMSFVIGIKEIDGELLYLNLGKAFGGMQQHAPHTLIAGATGSGKSVLLQNLILDICATNPVDLTHIYLIDPKMGVDFQHIEELPHLRGGIIIDQERAIEILSYLTTEMDARYLKFREQKVSNLIDYNIKAPLTEKIPVLWLIHDEFAEWMLIDSYKDAVSSTVQRLGVKARAAGIHLIFATQRPDANVLPVQLRDNLGNRLVLRVESVGTSEISLGEKGAEKLLGKGHLAARLSGELDIIYAQVPFLSDSQLLEVTKSLINN
jgi:S-DNA-T family DNA segregation ATPase FtsK/SpoIIIE